MKGEQSSMNNIFKKKSLKTSLLYLIALCTILLPFSNIATATSTAQTSSNCENGDCLQPPTSNVEKEEFNSILKQVQGTETYQELAQNTIIDSLEKSDIVINTVKDNSNSEILASIGFLIGENIQEDNLAYVEIGYNLTTEQIIYDKNIFTSANENGSGNVTMTMNDTEIFSMNFNDKGEIINQNGEVISQEEFYNSVVENHSGNISTASWCNTAISLLCGAGGAAGCWAAAAALGLTTGVGGVALSAVCGAISSLGCAGAANAIC